jgi:hypothetical protein
MASVRSRAPAIGRLVFPGDSSKSESSGRKPLPWKWALDRLRRAHTYWIVTVRPDGRPLAVPIWGVWVDGRFIFGAEATSVKIRNLTTDPRCKICLEEKGEALTVEGKASQMESEQTLRRMARAYKTKYDWSVGSSAGQFYQVEPRRVIGYIESSYPDRTTRWEFAQT